MPPGRPKTVDFKNMPIEQRRAYLRARVAEHKARDPEGFRAKQRASRARQVARYHERNGNRCAICHATKQLHRDHCHTTGEWRSTLCRHCNTGIGIFEENVGLLKRAIAYIEFFQAKNGA